MKKIDVAVKGILIKNGKMLIVKRAASDETSASMWESIGGEIAFGETLETALKREFLEESGLEITIECLLFSTTFLTSSVRQIVIVVYLCQCTNTTVTLSSEHEAYRWATKAELVELLPKHILDDYKKHRVLDLL